MKVPVLLGLVLVSAKCFAYGATSGGTSSGRWLLQATNNTSATPGLQGPMDSKPPDPKQVCFPYLKGPGSPEDGYFYMTATSKCPNDQFAVSFVWFAPDPSYVTYLAGADGPTAGAVKHQWMGRYLNNASRIYIVVLRKSDGKIVTPKGIKPDGTFYDISNTGRKVCQLFEQGSKPLDFAHFRAKASADGLKMIHDDFYSPGLEKVLKIPEGGIECDKYVDSETFGKFLGKKYGKVVTAYKPGSCRFGIDDCSS